MNIYDLSRSWFNYCFDNPEKIKPNHTALYFFCIEHCNRLGWKEKYGLPTTMAKEAIGIRSYNTYVNTLKDLVDWGFIIMIEKSKNQYSSNIIALSNFNKAHDKARDKALDKALVKHVTKQSESTGESTGESISSINKPINHNTNKPINHNTNKVKKGKHSFSNSPYSTLEKFKESFSGTDYEIADLDYYFEAVKNWAESSGSLKNDWKATARNFMLKDKRDNKLQTKNGNNGLSQKSIDLINW